MYHEGPPAVAVTDMGNAQNSSSKSGMNILSHIRSYTPKIKIVFTLNDFLQDVFLLEELVNNYNEIIAPDSSNKSSMQSFVKKKNL